MGSVYKTARNLFDNLFHRKPQLVLARLLCASKEDGVSSMYENRKYGHKLSEDNVKLTFEVPKLYPSGVFRDSSGETLGQGAIKGGKYKNAEYFSFHHMSYYDMHLALKEVRQPQPKTERKAI